MEEVTLDCTLVFRNYYLSVFSATPSVATWTGRSSVALLASYRWFLEATVAAAGAATAVAAVAVAVAVATVTATATAAVAVAVAAVAVVVAVAPAHQQCNTRHVTAKS